MEKIRDSLKKLGLDKSALTEQEWRIKKRRLLLAALIILFILSTAILAAIQQLRFPTNLTSNILIFAVVNLNLREALRLQAIRDPLTGLYNRRYMQEFLEREIHRARRRQRPLAVMMLDLDNFKRYNDTFGHPAGDDALHLVGDTLLHGVRAEDLACRYGGEEFAVILPECSLHQAAVRANEIRLRIKERSLEPASKLRDVVTVSIGVAAFEETTDRVSLLLKFADDALYRAKRQGRDRVVVARPVTAPPTVAPAPRRLS